MQLSFEKCVRERVAQVLTSADLTDSINVLTRHYSSAKPRLFYELLQAAKLVEPVDRTLGADQQYPAAHAFLWGEVLALHVLDDFMGEDRKDVKKILAQLNLSMTHEGDGQEESAREVMNMGSQGLRQAEIAEELIEKAETAACPDVTQHIYFQNGFGFIVLIATEMKLEIARKDYVEQMTGLIEQVESESFDWDEALKAL